MGNRSRSAGAELVLACVAIGRNSLLWGYGISWLMSLPVAMRRRRGLGCGRRGFEVVRPTPVPGDGRMTEAELARGLHAGAEVTTTLGRTVVVGAVHAGEAEGDGWWIEPLGAADHDWWVPVRDVVAVNGAPVSIA